MSAAVFAVQDLRLHVIESDSYVNIGVVFVGTAISFNAGSKKNWIPGINAHLANADWNLRRGGSFLKDLVELLRIVSLHFTGSIHDDLGGIWGLQSKSLGIGGLAFGQQRRRVWIFPAVMVPIINVFTEDDQLRTCDGLGSVHLL